MEWRGSLLLLAVSASVALGSRPHARAGSAFDLLAGASNVEIAVNRVSCNVNDIGEMCVDPGNSPVLGGGYWPRGTPDQYVYNGGLQVAAIIPDTAGFGWAGDTVGVFFYDPRGDQVYGQALTGVYNSLNAGDLDHWPAAAYANDTSLFDSRLIGQRAISEQDTWVRYWDGAANRTGRRHPMGLVVEQRTLAWNRPAANRDVIYFIYRLINATARDPRAYSALAAVGYSEADLKQLAAIGAAFQDAAEARDSSLRIPDGGFAWDSLYVAFAQDPDVGQAGGNHSTVSLPLRTSFAYKSDFNEPSWAFPPEIFHAPFAAAPGFVGVTFLRSAVNPTTGAEYGVTMWSNLTGGVPMHEPMGVAQLFRYLAGTFTLALGDPWCSRSPPLLYHVCIAVSNATDTRYYASSGPTTLGPGQSAVIVLALVHAPAVASRITKGSLNRPGFPETGERLVAGTDTVRTIERAAGWLTHSDLNGDGDLQPNEVTTEPGSLLAAAQLARAIFANKFLLPRSPDPPLFFLVPGDGQVTIAWQRSQTEITGDPYFAAASNPTSAVYDPNYREFDVEGYRVWRGRSPSDMRLIAQFDFTGTYAVDYTGQFWYGEQCAPELGVIASCPSFPRVHPLVGNVVQVPPGGRLLLANGQVGLFRADTAVTGGASGLPPLTDASMPYVFIDRDVRNGLPYVYSVTAFDINSIKSGPSSLESPMVIKTVTPRVTSQNVRRPAMVTGLFGGDGTALDRAAPFPSIDAATGTFGGPIPPANADSLQFLAGVVEALPPGEYTVRIDSISAGFTGGIGQAPVLYVSVIAGADTVRRTIGLEPPFFWDAPDVTYAGKFGVTLPLIPYDSSRARRLGLAFTQDIRMLARFSGAITPISATSVGNALVQGRYGVPFGAAGRASRYLLHSRWFDESAGTEPPQPTINPFGSQANTNGKLTGVSLIYSPLAYRLPTSGGTANRAISITARGAGYGVGAAWYPADFVVTWNADSSLSVRDSTHRLDLPFNRALAPGWGFINERAYASAGISAADLEDSVGTPQLSVVGYHHLYALNPVCSPEWWAIPCAPLERTAEYEALDWTNDGLADGNGIALVINGEPFLMQMSRLPAAGTKWHLRAVGGGGLSATCTPALPFDRRTDLLISNVPTSCSGYAYTPPVVRPAYAPGLRITLRVRRGFEVVRASGDLSRIHTVPDPYYFQSEFESTAGDRQLRFVNLPDRAVIWMYSASGILVTILTHNDPTGGGEEPWDLRSRNGHLVASGVYFYRVEAPDGRSRVGRFTVVNLHN